MNKLIFIGLCILLLLSSFVSSELNNSEAYYSYDITTLSGQSISDLSGNSHTATNNSALWVSNGILGGAFEFTGADNRYINDSNHNIDIKTISLWFYNDVNLSSSTQDDTLFSGDYSGGGYPNLHTSAYGGAMAGEIFNFEVDSGDFFWWDSSLVPAIIEIGWHFIALTWNDTASGYNLYLDGTDSGLSKEAGTPSENAIFSDFSVGIYHDDTREWDGKIDEIGIWNRSLSTSELGDLYNSGVGFNPHDIAITPSNASNLDVIVRNVTATSGDESVLDEDEHFYIYANWTNKTGVVLFNDTVGNCTASLDNGMLENESVTEDFTVCSSGCDYTTFTDLFTLQNSTSIETNFVEIDGLCHTNIITRDLTVNVSCLAGSEIITIDRTEFPACDSGTANILKETNVCNTTEINVSMTNTAGSLAQSHTIDELAYEREYTNLTLNMTYNTTLDLWRIINFVEYHKHGQKNLSVNCTHTSDTNYNNATSQALTIVNKVPIIMFNQMNNSGGIFNLSNDNDLEYYAGAWSFEITIDDDDITFINYTIYNQSGGQVYSINSTTPITLVAPNLSFVDFTGNPFNISVWVNDSNGNQTFRNITIAVNDTGDPICLGLNNFTINNNTEHEWTSACTDEHFFSFNITCTGGSTHSQLVTGLSTESYTYINSTTITANTTCEIEYCDGHTKNKISPMTFSDEDSHFKRTIDYTITLTSDTELDEFEFELEEDRYKFKIKTNNIVNNISFIIDSLHPIQIMDQVEFTGWIITQDYWIDFVNSEVKFARVSRINQTSVEVFLEFRHPLSAITFNSIGKLNCVSVTQQITSREATPDPFTLRRFDCDMNTTGKAIGIVGFTFMIIVIWIVGLWLRMPMLNFFFGFFLWYYAWIVAACFFWANLLFILLGLVSIIMSVNDWLMKNKYGSLTTW